MNGNDNDKVWVSVEITVNLGNYQNVKIQQGQSQTYAVNGEQIEDPRRLRQRLLNEVMEDCIDDAKAAKDDLEL